MPNGTEKNKYARSGTGREMTQEHVDEVVKFIQFGQRKVHLIIKEEGDIGEEYLRVEMRRNGEMKSAKEMNDRVVYALTSLINDGQLSAIVINRSDQNGGGNAS